MFLSFSIAAQELKSLFEKKSLKEKPPSSGKQSILSVRLEQCPLQLNNPFNEYSKFDGKVSSKVKRLPHPFKTEGVVVAIIVVVIIIIRFRFQDCFSIIKHHSFKTIDVKR